MVSEGLVGQSFMTTKEVDIGRKGLRVNGFVIIEDDF